MWALVLGALLTIAIGWTSALFASWDAGTGRDTYVVADGREWQLFEYRAIGGRTLRWQSMSGLNPMPGPGGRPMSVEEMEKDAAMRRQLGRCTLDSAETAGLPRAGVDSGIVHRAVEMR